MPNVSTGTKVTLRNLQERLKQGVPISKHGNFKSVSKQAVAKIYEGHLNGTIVYKTDSQDRILAYPKGFTPKRGRPPKAESAEIADTE